MFPKISKYLGAQWPHTFAGVYKGRLCASNTKIAYYGSVEILTDDPKQRDILEKKLFTMDDLLLLEKAERVEWRSDGFKITLSDGKTEYRDWSGEIDDSLVIYTYDDLMGEMVPNPNSPKFYDYSRIIPCAGHDGQIDEIKFKNRGTYFRSIGLPSDSLQIIGDSFHFVNPDKKYLTLDLIHADPSKDKVERPSAPIVVTPKAGKYKQFMEMAVIMPVMDIK